MTVYLPTLKQLQYLVALRDNGHFGRAAESCFVTQSTLSAGLRELELLLGITLVERTRRVVRFTPLGSKIAEKARTRPARNRGIGRHGACRRPAAGRRPQAGRDPDHRAVPATRDAAAASRGLARPEALPARGNQPGGVRRAPSRAARLRPAGDAVQLRRRRCRSIVRRSTCTSPVPPTKCPIALPWRAATSPPTGCCCSRTAIA